MTPDDQIPRLTVNRHINQSSGQTTVQYFWDGKRIPQVRLVGVMADRLSGLALIQKDLVNALRWMEKAEKLMSEHRSDKKLDTQYFRVHDREIGDEVKSLFVSSLVFYAKAFTEASGRKAQMSRDWLDVEFRAAHDFFLMYRHNMAAHSGDEKLELAHSFILLIPERGGMNCRLATNRVQPDIAMSEDDNERFTTLIKHAIEKIEEKYHHATRRIIEAATSKGLDFWVEASTKQIAIDTAELLLRKL